MNKMPTSAELKEILKDNQIRGYIPTTPNQNLWICQLKEG